MHVRRSFVKTFGLLIVAALLLAALPVEKVMAQATLCVNPGGTGICYASVMDAIVAAGDGDTITVAAGEYSENLAMIVNQSVTIEGAGADTTIIKPNGAHYSYTAPYERLTHWFTIYGGTFKLSDVTLDGEGYYENPIYSLADVNISDCIIEDFTGDAIDLFYGTSNISDNTITGNGVGDYYGYGVYVGSGAKATISGNTISNYLGVPTGDTRKSAGIVVSTFGAYSGWDFNDATITGNTLSGNTVGLLVGGINDVDKSTLTATGNTFADNKYQIEQNAVAPGITFSLVDAFADNTFDKAVMIEGGTTVYTSIQEAIDAASAGDTILVAAGTYIENVTVSKSVSLIGAGRDLVTVNPLDTDMYIFGVGASNVTISGFKVTGTSGNGISLGDVSPNCIIKDNELSGNGKYGLSIDSLNNTVTNNLITNNAGSNSSGAGIGLFKSGNVINFNTITGNSGFGGLGSIATGENDAIQNWWGSATGPTHVSNPGGTGDKIWTNKDIDLITYSPWCTNPECTTFGTPAPTLDEVLPAAGSLDLSATGYFVLTVDADDVDGNLAELEIDHSMEGTLPEFSVYADASNPYGDDEALFAAAGMTVTYDATEMVWVIDFGPVLTAQFLANDGITFYLVLKDAWGNEWGSMSPTNPGNTFAYTMSSDTTPPTLGMSPAAGSVPNCYGETTVNVMVGAVDQLAGYDIRVNYDPTLVEIIKVENGDDLTKDWMSFVDPLTPAGQLHLAGYNNRLTSGPNLVSSTTGFSLVKITLKPKTAADVVLTLDTDSELTRTEDARLSPYAIGQLTSTVTTTTANVLNTTKNIPYCSLQAAVTAADADDNLQVLTDFEVPAQVDIDKTLSFDTNGFTVSRTNLTGNYDGIFNVVANGGLAISGSGTLSAISGYQGAPVTVDGGVVSLADATLKGPYASIQILADSTFNMTSGTADGCIVIKGTGATANISGGLVQGTNDFAIAGNGIAENGGTIINISGTAKVKVVDDTNVAIYHPQDGELNISGGTISGYNGIEMKAGNLNVTGGAILGKGAYVALPDPNDNGSVNTGDAILLNGRNAYTGDITVDISGGTITADYGWALLGYRATVAPNEQAVKITSVEVDGGVFTGGQGAVFFTDNDSSVLKLVVGGAYNTDPGASPDYVYDPFGTYGPISGYYYIEEMKTVSGVVSMQGRTTRAGVPLALMSGSPLAASYNATSTDPSGNYSFGLVSVQPTYVFTTNQPRYLNVTADLNKEITVTADRVLPDLRLFGGDANTDDTVDLGDAGIVGGFYGTGTIEDNGDVNFDGRVNIQDLALVGGNYDLTSAVAYTGWTP